MVEKGHIGMKSKKGLWDWNDESMARTKAEYETALHAGFEILQADTDKK